MKRIIIFALFLLLIPISQSYSQVMTGGTSDTAIVRLQPHTWTSSKVVIVDQSNRIVYFKNGSFIRVNPERVEMALNALLDDSYVSIRWTERDDNGNFQYDQMIVIKPSSSESINKSITTTAYDKCERKTP